MRTDFLGAFAQHLPGELQVVMDPMSRVTHIWYVLDGNVWCDSIDDRDLVYMQDARDSIAGYILQWARQFESRPGWLP